MKAAAVSKTSDGTPIVVAVLEASTEEGMCDLASRWVGGSGRLFKIPDTAGVKEAEDMLNNGVIG